jgi:BirA family biotin operon repressor/biotin-[acetyl-CoA-carboxylase] ligase
MAAKRRKRRKKRRSRSFTALFCAFCAFLRPNAFFGQPPMTAPSLDSQILRALGQSAVHLTSTDLANQLGAPAETVESRLAELCAAGFEIEDRPGFGFRLLGAPDRLVADDLIARLGDGGFIREIVVFEETDSTNDFAMRRGRQGGGGGFAVFAERQTAGRGRFGRRWDSASHQGIWFSLLLRPSLPFAEWPRLTTWAAVSLASAIEETIRVRTEIKWPNDIYIEGKKISGILAEVGVDVAGKSFAVVGIGVNVNHLPADFPKELSGKAGSLREFKGELVDRSALTVALLRALDARAPDLEHAFENIVRDASVRSVLLGRWIRVQAGEAISEGIAEKLDEDGHLLLRTADGGLSRLTAGEVTIISRKE